MEEVRLQKYLADSGIASRRKAEELINSGKVLVNNEVAVIGQKVIIGKDEVKYNGKIVQKKDKDYVYILLNKPIAYVTTVRDQFDRPTILDLVKISRRVVPVRKIRYVYFWSNNINR